MAMAAIPTFRIVRPGLTSAPADAVLSSLVPSASCTRSASAARFSTSPALWKRDNNKDRGVSALRHTGPRPRQTLSVREKDYKSQELPKPVKRTEKVQGTEDHGLWDFFKDKKLLCTPAEESKHGREWTVGELRERDWDVLHRLWWVCVKERNRLATEKLERKRQKTGYGDEENKQRDETVQKTMKAILDTLAERHQAYQEAHQLARTDPDVNWNGPEGPIYEEPTHEENDQFEESDGDAAEQAQASRTQSQSSTDPAKQTSPSRGETLTAKTA